ncbi:MAG: barstar family protein [Nocardioides sp.]
MSGLAALLAGRKEPGLYSWHGAFSPDDVQHTVEHAGWDFAYVDGWHVETKKEFLDAVGEAFHFPDYYGRNFDAMADCLHDVKADHGNGVLLLWDGWGPARPAHNLEKAFTKALQAFRDRIAEEHDDKFADAAAGRGPRRRQGTGSPAWTDGYQRLNPPRRSSPTEALATHSRVSPAAHGPACDLGLAATADPLRAPPRRVAQDAAGAVVDPGPVQGFMTRVLTARSAPMAGPRPGRRRRSRR